MDSRTSLSGVSAEGCTPFVDLWWYYYQIIKTRDSLVALQAFRDRGGILRTRDLAVIGVHTDALYALRDQDQVVELGRGLYHLADAGESEHPDLTIVAANVP